MVDRIDFERILAIKPRARVYTARARKENARRQAEYRIANPWHDSFQAARARCVNVNNPRYARYGGRGIRFRLTVEDMRLLWQRDRANFLEAPSIDRIDNDGDYCFENCRIIELGDNARKRSKHLKI